MLDTLVRKWFYPRVAFSPSLRSGANVPTKIKSLFRTCIDNNYSLMFPWQADPIFRIQLLEVLINSYVKFQYPFRYFQNLVSTTLICIICYWVLNFSILQTRTCKGSIMEKFTQPVTHYFNFINYGSFLNNEIVWTFWNIHSSEVSI